MRSTERPAKIRSPRTGFFATLRPPLHTDGSSAPLRRYALVSALVLAALALSAAPALAAHVFTGSFGGPCVVEPLEPCEGKFSGPSGVAVNEVTLGDVGDVYVVDKGNNRVEQFDSTGTFITQFNGSSAPTGPLSSPEGIAVDNSGNPLDPSAGDVYVVDAGHAVLDKFSAEGAYLGQITTGAGGAPFGEVDGVAVDPAGVVWVYLRNGSGTGEIDSFSNGMGNEFISSRESPFGAAPGFAVDSEDNLYVNRGGHVFAKLDSGGNEEIGEVDSEESRAAAVDQFSDHVFIDNVTSVGEFGLAPGCTASQPCEANPEAALDRFGSGELTEGSGVGVNSATNTVYVTDAATSTVSMFTGPVLPAVQTGEATNLEGKGIATLNGTLNPRGIALSSCEFEYGTDEFYGQTAACATLPSGSSPAAVQADVTGLTPGTTYHYRLVAANINGSQPGKDRTFFAPTQPVVGGEFASGVTASTATFHAQVNPEGLKTNYHFEYGTSTAYGSSIPVPDGTLVPGTHAVSVIAQLSGLTANTTYHWRILASNIDGASTGADHTFRYDTSGEGLPDGRAYEMVTPPNKNGAMIDALFFGQTPPQIAQDGTALTGRSIQCFAGSESCVGSRQSEGALFEFARTAGGWVTHPLSPSAASFQSNSTYTYDINEHTALFSAPAPPFGGDHFYLRRPDGTFTDIGPIGEGATSYGVVVPDTPSTADYSHFTYGTVGSVWSFDATTTLHSLYEYSGTGNSAPALVAVSGGPGSTDLLSTCGAVVGGGATSVYGSISGDGGTVYFTAGPCESGSGLNAGKELPVAQLYARIDGARTIQISTPTPASCTTPVCQGSTPAPAFFQGASTDGSKAFFTTAQQLTDDAVSGGLYESECPNRCEDPSQRRLIDVSAGAPGGDPELQGVVAISPEGSHVYFVAKSILTTTPNGQGRFAQSGEENLYGYQRDSGHPEGQLSFIATLAESDQLAWSEGVGVANVTPDGSQLVFTSHRGLTTDATRPEGPAQVYDYDAQTGVLQRISIGERGYNDNGNAGASDATIVPARNAFLLGSGPGRADPTMSHDGSYIFFQSPVGLTTNALDEVSTTGTSGLLAENVYEYHHGHVSLISDGKDITERNVETRGAVELLGSDETGANVFFATADQLTPQDTDTQRDYYDAHICTVSDPCIPPAPPPPPPCEGEACHGAASAAPVVGPPASATFSGTGNLLPPAPTTPAPRPLTRAQKLTKALKACHSKRNKHKRVACEKSARKKYGAKPRAKARKGGK